MNIDFTNPAWQTAVYGMEREALRINPDGTLALTPHPAAFGDKLENEFITTDFSESQVEMISPPIGSRRGLVDFMDRLYDYTVGHLENDEALWPLSMPCILPEEIDIPIARYTGEAGEKAMEYRRGLLAKYGGKRQLISGIHFNFSFQQQALLDLQKQWNDHGSLQDFQNRVYLKIARNYLRYGFVVVALFGCANVAHQSFDPQVLQELERRDEDSFMLKNGISIRGSRYGYCNDKPLYPDYSSLEHYMHSVEQFVNAGALSQPKELYAVVRLKSRQPGWDQLKQGISYLELRNIDIDPTAKIGIATETLDFLHLFLLFLLDEEESDAPMWQQEGAENRLLTAESGLQKGLVLHRDGKPVLLETYLYDILKKMQKIAQQVKISLPEPGVGQLAKTIGNQGFVPFGLKRAMQYQEAVKETIPWKEISSFR